MKDGNISEDKSLSFDEMYLQKSEEYFGGELIGSDKNGELDKGIVCFMIEGLKESIPCDHFISRNNNAVLHRDELFECPDAQIELQWNKFFSGTAPVATFIFLRIAFIRNIFTSCFRFSVIKIILLKVYF